MMLAQVFSDERKFKVKCMDTSLRTVTVITLHFRQIYEFFNLQKLFFVLKLSEKYAQKMLRLALFKGRGGGCGLLINI